MKIKQKLILSYLAISLLGAIAGYLGIKTIERVRVSFDRIADQTIPVKNELNNLERSVDNLINCSLELILLNKNKEELVRFKPKLETKDFTVKSLEKDLQKDIDEIELDKKAYQASLSRYKALVKLYFPEEQPNLEAIARSSQKIIEMADELISWKEKNNSALQFFKKQQELDFRREEFKEAIQTAIEGEHRELAERKENLHSRLAIATEVIFDVSFFNVLLAITIGIFVAISISRPIEKLKVAAVAIGKGELGTKIHLFSKDELGLLAQTFNKMAEDLQQYITSLQQAQAAKALMAKALENVADAIEITDSKAKYLYVNPAFEKITGYTEQEVLGQTPALLRSGKHEPEFYQQMLDTVYKKQIWHGLLVSKHKDDTLYDQEVTLSPILDAAGILTHIVAVKRDITDRKRAEEALRESEERFRVLVSYAPVGIFQTDKEGNCLFVNPRWLALTDLPMKAAMGLGWLNAIHPDDRPQVLAKWDEANQTGREFSMEYRFRTYDGETIWVFGSAVAIRDRTGAIVGYFGTVTDITDRKQIEATLREAERRWRTLLESVRLVVVGLDRAGNVEYVNPFFLELSGYTHKQVIGKNWFANFIPRYQQKQVQECFLEVIEQNLHAHYQNPIRTKSGEERAIAWNNTLLHTPQGEIIGTMSIGEDITERQAIERMKDEFVSVVSHELRTPLASIQGALSLLASGLMSAQSDKGCRAIAIAAASADRLGLLVNDILELERLEFGKIKLAKKLCDVNEMMLKAIETMQVMANRAGVRLLATPQDLQLYVDCDRLIQVLTNLLGNAIKFSARGAIVWLNVKLKAADEIVLFEVKDQGRGIPIDKLDSIFERFHQVDASDSRKKGGTGLGLAICRSIVEQHGGQIWVESILGEGSSFFFTLPKHAIEDNYDNQEDISDRR